MSGAKSDRNPQIAQFRERLDEARELVHYLLDHEPRPLEGDEDSLDHSENTDHDTV